jgi:hypothetical protein
MLARDGRWLAAMAMLGACTANEPPPPERHEATASGVLNEAETVPAPSSMSPREGLAKYAQEEDRVRKALLDAKRAKNKADETEYTASYKALIAESDEYAHRVLTPEFIASVPWTDLLSGEMATRWSKSSSVPGFSCRIENGVMTVTPPDAGTKQQGVAGIFDQRTDDLRNFELDMEFAVEGTVTMFFHVSPAPQNPDNRQSHTFDLVAKDGALKPDRKYHMVAEFIGGALTIAFPPIGDQEPIATWSPDPSWVKLRRGGIAFLVPEGARLTVTRMRIKDLR